MVVVMVVMTIGNLQWVTSIVLGLQSIADSWLLCLPGQCLQARSKSSFWLLPVTVHEASLDYVTKEVCFCPYWSHNMSVFCHTWALVYYTSPESKRNILYHFLPKANKSRVGFWCRKLTDPHVSRIRSRLVRCSRAVCTNTTTEACLHKFVKSKEIEKNLEREKNQVLVFAML